MIILRPYQADLKQGIYNSWNAGHKNVLMVLPTGGGKCFKRGTEVLMHDGTVKTVETITVGEHVMGPDGKTRKVVNLHSGMDQMYEITPVKGASYIVNSEHVLSLRMTNLRSKPKYPCQKLGGSIVNIPVKEYINKSKNFKHVHKGWRSGVNFETPQDLQYDPYWLGLWLGDGTARNTAVTTKDAPIVEYLIEYAEKVGLKCSFARKPNNKAQTVNIIGKQPRNNPLLKFLKCENLYRNKHIPHNYKTASEKQRLQLLAGLMDSDGYYTGKGYDICLKSEKLLDDLIFVARSLGFSAYKRKVSKTCVNNGVVGTYFRCVISGNIEKIPCILERKKARPRKQKKNVLNVGISVEPVGVGEYFGFEVQGNDSLFLLADFTVVHNSVVISDIVLDKHMLGATQCVIAHRTELVSQMSMHIAQRGIKHRIIAPKNVINAIRQDHRREFGRNFVDPTSNCSVGGVDTIWARRAELKDWAEQIDDWTIDEGHHAIGAVISQTPETVWNTTPNKWGRVANMFKNANGLGVTATPQRADGQGLGRHHDGLYDEMVTGPTMRQLIEMGSLSDYQIAIPETDFIIDDSAVTATGDYSRQKMKMASEKSHIVGNVVDEYVKLASGKRAICFATDVETSGKIAEQFKAAGINAVSISAKTPAETRAHHIRQFREDKIKILVNVDLFGEGFDCPAVEVVIMARPTASLGVYLQQFGRALRLMEGKLYGLIIDHVSNWKRHGFPDKAHIWTLDRREKRGKREPDPEDIPLTACRGCSRPYEKFHAVCPYCGHEPVPMGAARSIEHVDGDLVLMDRETIAQMMQAAILESPMSVGQRIAASGVPVYAAKGHVNRQIEKHQAQQRLTVAINQWAGIQQHLGRADQESYRRFYLTAQVDVLTAMTLSRVEMEKLAATVEGWNDKWMI